MSVIDDLKVGLIRTLGRTEAFIIGTAVWEQFKIERHAMSPAVVVDAPDIDSEVAYVNGVPLIVSRLARPDTIEVLWRDVDGDLAKGMLVSATEFAERLSEALNGGDGFR